MLETPRDAVRFLLRAAIRNASLAAQIRVNVRDEGDDFVVVLHSDERATRVGVTYPEQVDPEDALRLWMAEQSRRIEAAAWQVETGGDPSGWL